MIIQLWRKLIGLCNHQWYDHQEITIYNGHYKRENALPTGRKMRQRCELCKEFRTLVMD